MKKKIIGLCLVLLLATGCGKTPKLENGSEAIVSFKDSDAISVDDYYNEIKNKYGLQILVNMIDKHILEKEFSDYKETASKNAEAYVEAQIEQYGTRSEFLTYLQNYGYQSIEDYQDYYYLAYLQSHAVEEYAKEQITDKEIEDYYNNVAIGDMDLSHILITSSASSSASDDEKKAAEEEAKAKANEVIEKLNTAKNNGEDIATTFAELASEYSDDSSTKSNSGSLGKITYGDLDSSYDELIDAAKKLNDGEYSTSIITTELGYHVILKTKSYEKDTLENLSDEIRTTLSETYIEDNQNTVGLSALQHYRKKYDMNIEDSELSKQYSNYIQNALASSSSSSSN